MKKSISMLAILSALSAPVIAADHDLAVSLTNLTNAIYFTPVIAAAHDGNAHIFRSGMPASENLQALAEGGSIVGVSTELQSLGANVVENPAEGMLAPGASTTFQFMKNESNTYFSIASMMLPTNDGFVGADSIKLPTTPGTYTYLLNAYDAGTEANDEIINGGGALGAAGIPKDPGATDGVSDNTGATGVTTTETNTSIHIHRGVQGDNNASGGTSDLTNHVHRWLNPVAKLVITVK